ncbi:unnamed protein product [Rhizophagus irregularis]|uniref:Uncharacterized protein n=1 Tax=Rhizophagus irregularis TaxID=588596 RepID=A0A2I1HBK3_9GLOM|nr:hypothetical protein RhiirA4_476443 [Rhizophagus irregularis]CAB4443997.1 unnamed protein product [Rhizophagus irregularis]
MNNTHDWEVVYAKACTSIEQLNGNLKMSFFYNPPDDHQNYHITCEEVPVSFELVYQLTNDTDDNDRAYNYVQSDSYVFYHSQLNTKKIYRVTCELASSQFLNKRFYNIEYENNSSLFNPNNDNIQQGV